MKEYIKRERIADMTDSGVEVRKKVTRKGSEKRRETRTQH